MTGSDHGNQSFHDWPPDCAPLITTVSITCQLVRNAHFGSLAQTHWIRNPGGRAQQSVLWQGLQVTLVDIKGWELLYTTLAQWFHSSEKPRRIEFDPRTLEFFSPKTRNFISFLFVQGRGSEGLCILWRFNNAIVFLLQFALTLSGKIVFLKEVKEGKAYQFNLNLLLGQLNSNFGFPKLP